MPKKNKSMSSASKSRSKSREKLRSKSREKNKIKSRNKNEIKSRAKNSAKIKESQYKIVYRHDDVVIPDPEHKFRLELTDEEKSGIAQRIIDYLDSIGARYGLTEKRAVELINEAVNKTVVSESTRSNVSETLKNSIIDNIVKSYIEGAKFATILTHHSFK